MKTFLCVAQPEYGKRFLQGKNSGEWAKGCKFNRVVSPVRVDGEDHGVVPVLAHRQAQLPCLL
jgi:hypothetical protein